MSTLREAAQQALEALESTSGNINPERGYVDELENEVTAATKALRAALEQPEQPEQVICTAELLLRSHLRYAEWHDKMMHPFDGEPYQIWTLPVWLPVPESAQDKSPEAALEAVLKRENT